MLMNASHGIVALFSNTYIRIYIYKHVHAMGIIRDPGASCTSAFLLISQQLGKYITRDFFKRKPYAWKDDAAQSFFARQ
jgi:hypothetical protein